MRLPSILMEKIMPIINGTDSGDILIGTEGNDEIYGGNGNDKLYGRSGQDFLQGNRGNDELYGEDGDDLLRGGKDDDKLLGGSGADTLMGDLGSNELTGGTGNDTYIIPVKPNSFDIIHDFELNNPYELIDISELINIKSFNHIKITTTGNDSHIDLGQEQILILKNLNSTQITSRHFRAPWSVSRTVNIYDIGAKLEPLFNRIGATVKKDFKHYIIKGADFASNPQNSDPFLPWNKIDLTRFGLTEITLVDRGIYTEVALGDGIKLDIYGVRPVDLSLKNHFILSKNDNRWKEDLVAEWLPNDKISVVPSGMSNDQIVHQDGELIYYAFSSRIVFINLDMGSPSVNFNNYVITQNDPNEITIEDYNPNNSVIDVSAVTLNNYENLFLQKSGADTIVRFSSESDRAILLRNTHPSEVSSNSFYFGTNQHQNSDGIAVTTAGMSEDVYYFEQKKQLGNWQRYQETSNSIFGNSDSFFAAVYVNEKDKKLILAIRGTDDLHDTFTDGRYSLGVLPSDLAKAQQYFEVMSEKLKQNPKYADYNWEAVTGHSLGGLVAQLLGMKNNINTYTYENPGASPFLYLLGIDPSTIDFNKHWVMLNAVPNIVSTAYEQIGKLFTYNSDVSVSFLSDKKISVPLNFISTALDTVGNEFPLLRPLVELISPENYGFLLFDSHSSKNLDSAVRNGLTETRWYDNIIEGLAYRIVTGGKKPSELTSSSKLLWEQLKPFLGKETEHDTLLNALPLTPVIYRIDDIVMEELRSYSNGLAISITADLILGQSFDEIKKGMIVSIKNNIVGHISVDALKTVPGLDNAVQLMTEGLATNLAGKLVLGHIKVDDIPEETLLYFTGAQVGAIGNSIGMALATIIPLPGIAVLLIGQVAGSIIYRYAANAVLKIWSSVERISEIVWDFLGDPINTLDDLWDKLNDDKWTYRIGTSSAEIMFSDSKWEDISAKAGDDLVVCYDGWNRVYGGEGDDILIGGAGTLTENYIRPDEIYGGYGDDYINGREADDALAGNAGADYILGGDGNDYIWGGDRANDPHQQMTTGDSADILHGGRGNDQLFGGEGGDSLYGDEGDDKLYGEMGDDHLEGGLGSDRLDGGMGIDTVYYTQSSQSVRVNLLTGIASGGDAEGDTFFSIEHLVGSAFNDQLSGNNEDNFIYGGEGNDTLIGFGGNDTLLGGPGNDILQPSGGFNTLTGNAGNDTFIIDRKPDSTDTITDYADEDKIILKGFSNLTDITQANSIEYKFGLKIDLGQNQFLILQNITKIGLFKPSVSPTVLPIYTPTTSSTPSVLPTPTLSPTPSFTATPLATHSFPESTAAVSPTPIITSFTATPSLVPIFSTIPHETNTPDVILSVSSANRLMPLKLNILLELPTIKYITSLLLNVPFSLDNKNIVSPPIGNSKMQLMQYHELYHSKDSVLEWRREASWDLHQKTKLPIFHFNLIQNNKIVGKALLYGSPIFCRSRSGKQNNIFKLEGVLTGQESYIDSTVLTDNICKSLPPSSLQQQALQSATQGVVLGLSNLLGKIAKKYNYSDFIVQTIVQSSYYTALFLTLFARYYQELSEISGTALEDEILSYDAMYRALIDITRILAIRVTSSAAQTAGKKLTENGWTKTGYALSYIGSFFNYSAYTLPVVNAVQQPDVTTAMETLKESSVCIASGVLAQLTSEKVGGYVLSV